MRIETRYGKPIMIADNAIYKNALEKIISVHQ